MAEFTRRKFLQLTGGTGAGLMFVGLKGTDWALALPVPRGTLNPTSTPKFVSPLVVPAAMPRTGKLKSAGQDIDYYEVAVRQFDQQILPPGKPTTTVWSYGSANHPSSFVYPACTIEAKSQRP